MEAFTGSGIGCPVFFHTPNIHPLKAYALRKQENIHSPEKHGVPFVVADYDADSWFARPGHGERGIRCMMRFDMRFEHGTPYAHAHGFTVMTRSPRISRGKNMARINDCGRRAVAPNAGLACRDHDWRKGGGSQRMIENSKLEYFCQQECCGGMRQQPPPAGAGVRQDQVRSGLLRRPARTGRRPR